MRTEAQQHVYTDRNIPRRVTDDIVIRRNYLHASNKAFAFRPRVVAPSEVGLGLKRDRQIVAIPYQASSKKRIQKLLAKSHCELVPQAVLPRKDHDG